MLNKTEIKTFKRIWFEEFGEKISTEQVLIQNNKLITFFKTIANYLEIKEQKNENQNQDKNESKTLEK
jgi:hypothetical protein